MPNRLQDTEIWKKDWFLELSTKQKLLVKFLFDNCDCAGFYKISWNLLKFYFSDTEITKEDFTKIKQLKFIQEDLIFLEDFVFFQYKVKNYNHLNPNNNAHRGVLKLLDKYNIYTSPSLGANEGLISPKLAPQDKDKNKNKDKDKDKDKDINQSLYGEYNNVCLSSEHYGKLLSMCMDKDLLNELINSFSVNIEVGKERPYNADLPNAHYERLKAYYSYRKKYPDKFREEQQSQSNKEWYEKMKAKLAAKGMY